MELSHLPRILLRSAKASNVCAYFPFFFFFFFEGYYLGFGFFSGDTPVLKPWLLPLKWQMYLVICVVLPVCATIIASYWSRNKWSNHHLAKTLRVRFILRQSIF